MAVTQQVKQKDREISCLILPTQSIPLLLPNEAVAEIVTEKKLPRSSSDDWFLGYVDWRATQMPLICFERFSGKIQKSLPSISFMAVLNGYKGDERLPFFGLVIAGLPSLERVFAAELVEQEAQLSEAERFRVRVSGTLATIPSLECIESAIIQRLDDASV